MLAIQQQLLSIEQSLKDLAWWQATMPSQQALNSCQPFCVDSLSFPQWLQFILLPKMQALLDAEAALPRQVDIFPYAEEALKNTSQDVSELLALIRDFDQSFS